MRPLLRPQLERLLQRDDFASLACVEQHTALLRLMLAGQYRDFAAAMAVFDFPKAVRIVQTVA